MKSETLQRRITIERNFPTVDAFNNPLAAWVRILDEFASWRHATANEQLAAQETQAAVDAVFEIRWSTLAASVNPKDRLKYDGRTYDITEAIEIGRREGVRIRAAARSDQA